MPIVIGVVPLFATFGLQIWVSVLAAERKRFASAILRLEEDMVRGSQPAVQFWQAHDVPWIRRQLLVMEQLSPLPSIMSSISLILLAVSIGSDPVAWAFMVVAVGGLVIALGVLIATLQRQKVVLNPARRAAIEPLAVGNTQLRAIQRRLGTVTGHF